jgi:hypothetical protein
MSNVTIHLPADTERRLREKATVCGKSLEAYLQELAESDARAANGTTLFTADKELSLDEVDRLLDELSEGLPPLPALPIDFSRDDLYADHD